MPFFGNCSYKFKNNLVEFLESNIHCIKINVIFTGGSTIGDMFPYKDRMPFMMNSHLVYKINCDACSASYFGKTIVTLDERFYKHLITKEHSDLKEHIKKCGPPHNFNIDNIKILDRHSDNYTLETMESILISYHKPSLNKNKTSVQ